MELKTIQYFLRIVDKGSLSKAAESLYLSQPTLSRYLARLEENVGARLFQRKKDSSLELTESGRIYLQAARQIDEIWNHMSMELSALEHSHAHTIRLGYDSDIMLPRIHVVTTIIAKQYPQVKLQLRQLTSEEIQEETIMGNIDIGVASFFDHNDLLVYPRILRCEIDLVVSNIHPLAKYSYHLPGQEAYRAKLSDLDPDTPFLMMRDHRVLRKRVNHYMKEHQFDPYILTTYSRQDMLPQLLQASEKCVCFCPRWNAFPELSYIALDPPFFHERGFCYRKGKTLTPAEAMLIDLLHP